ncbi:hypothetical protein HELRODRAFT_171168 [Helobdella robusta]|uniref:Fucolectin tachylectin-4 pentraxin-1 domain-containing protein n=1 Tax=Helobdella robusta TaxID=6412 RepID=T1F3W3_HELRO|nr:hypothetical protein HELRODRAFT_171168 [Helobdella robusta]ESO05530.1 hypothetical protein HELRODRAFT_171168 [Helobdella robusta]
MNRASNGVDGDPSTIVQADQSYPDSNWFVVDLINAYHVEYISLHTNPNCVGGCGNGYHICDTSPFSNLPADHTFTVPCGGYTEFYRFVIIQRDHSIEEMLSDKQLQFAELEVYANDILLRYSNVALNQPAYMSTEDLVHSPSLCVDGDKTTFCLLSPETPIYENWFAVDLIQKFKVVYVVLYSRSGCCYDTMDNFLVGLTNYFDPKVNKTIRDNYEFCGQYPKTVSADFQPMRVDCININIYSRFVIIQQEAAKAGPASPMTFAELENGEHCMCGTPPEPGKTYVSCGCSSISWCSSHYAVFSGITSSGYKGCHQDFLRILVYMTI